MMKGTSWWSSDWDSALMAHHWGHMTFLQDIWTLRRLAACADAPSSAPGTHQLHQGTHMLERTTRLRCAEKRELLLWSAFGPDPPLLTSERKQLTYFCPSDPFTVLWSEARPCRFLSLPPLSQSLLQNGFSDVWEEGLGSWGMVSSGSFPGGMAFVSLVLEHLTGLWGANCVTGGLRVCPRPTGNTSYRPLAD